MYSLGELEIPPSSGREPPTTPVVESDPSWMGEGLSGCLGVPWGDRMVVVVIFLFLLLLPSSEC